MRRLFLSILASLVLLMGASPALAQSGRPGRPYRGLFGGGLADMEQILTANASIGGGFDSNLVADARGGDDLRPSDLNTTVRGGVGQASGSLLYALSLPRVSIGASAGTSARYYPSLGSDIVRRDQLSAQASLRLTSWLSANLSAAYAPFSLSSVFPVPVEADETAPAVPEWDFASSIEHFVAYGGNIGVNRQLSRRTAVSGSYSQYVRDASVRGGRFERQSAGGQLTYQLGRGLGLRGGYRYEEASYQSSGATFQNHVIDAGVDFNRNLSFSRRTTLSFATGTTSTTRQDEGAQFTRFRVTGHASLNHEMGRTWNAILSYRRGMQFNESLAEPVFTDAASASLGGLLGRHIQFHSSIRASNGKSGFADASIFNGYYANAQIGYALTRHMSLGCQYAFYHHNFGDAALLAPGFPAEASRHSVRAYVNLWTPLFQKSRRADATR